MERKMMKKVLVMVLALSMVCVASVAGTLAYLSHKTDKVTNTFVIGTLFEEPEEDFALWEKKLANDGVGVNGVFQFTDELVTSNIYKNILPGVNVSKDPFVRVDGLKEEAYLFLVVEDNTGDHIDVTIDDSNWDLYKETGNTKVYIYQAEGDGKIDPNANSQDIHILKDNLVTVSKDFTGGSGIDISFKAYIIQSAGLADCDAAWAAVNP